MRPSRMASRLDPHIRVPLKVRLLHQYELQVLIILGKPIATRMKGISVFSPSGKVVKKASQGITFACVYHTYESSINSFSSERLRRTLELRNGN